MKKIFLSLLTLAATMNIMAAAYSAKATITLESQSSYESCQMIIGQSDELNAGLNNGEYAEINMEGRSVALYVEYNGVKYQHFASNPATMTDLVLSAKTDAATTYNLIISDVSGAEKLKLRIGDEEFDVVAGTRTITLAPNQTTAIGLVNPSAPAVPSICFNYNHLIVTGYAGSTLKVEKAGVAVVAEQTLASDNEDFDLSAENGRLVVTLDGVEYQIDANPAVTPVP